MSFAYDYSIQEDANSLGSSSEGHFVAPTNANATAGTGAAVAPISGTSGSISADSKTTLWMGELDPWMDEAAIKQIWSSFGENVSIKLIRDKFSGGNAGYCFVEFATTAAASTALSLNGQPIPNSQRVFKLNWASGGGLFDKRDDRSPEYSIFVGDLAPDVSEFGLLQLFQSRYPSCKSAKIMTDPSTNISRGYGFVRFSDEGDMQRSLTEMQGFFFGNRPMRISTATPKNKPVIQGGVASAQGPQGGAYSQPGHMGMSPYYPPYYGAPQSMNQFTDPNNTTVFVGGLSGHVSEEELRRFFTSFGDITYVKIPPGKGCGFVQFVQRHSAEAAITQMQGYPIGNSRVRLSWGRSQNSNGPANTSYRATHPPPSVYPQIGMPAQPHYGPFGPINPQNAHIHAPPPPGNLQPVPGQDPSEPIPVARLNELYLAARDGRLDRVESDGRGYHGVYAQ